MCNFFTNTSSQTCYVCHCTPKNMNDITKSSEAFVNSENVKYGLSTLHAWIRLFECLLDMSYRLDLKNRQVNLCNYLKCTIKTGSAINIYDAFLYRLDPTKTKTCSRERN